MVPLVHILWGKEGDCQANLTGRLMHCRNGKLRPDWGTIDVLDADLGSVQTTNGRGLGCSSPTDEGRSESLKTLALTISPRWADLCAKGSLGRLEFVWG